MPHRDDPNQAGLIGLFTRHPTAANLLMALMILVGFAALSRINTQFFPDFGIEIITVRVEWPGATAEDIDTNIVQAMEPELRFLDQVKRLRSSSVEGAATVAVEFESGSDMQQALSDVESAVDLVTTLPEEAEQPEIQRITRYDTISRLVLSGPYSERALAAFARDMRDQLLDRGVDKVDLFGNRGEEIWVEVSPEALRRLDLTPSDIAARIKETSQDVPSGDLDGGTRQVRSLGLLRDARGLQGVEIKALDNGRKLLLGDIADVKETFEDGGQTAMRNGNPAIELHIQRSVNADALELAQIVREYLSEIRPTLPRNLTLEQYDVISNLIEDRIDLLINNGLGGLILVLVVLFLFLNWHVALWVAVGIPVSLLATIAVMFVTGQTINMISLFGLIMAIGIVVDDAIVVGEHTEARREAGLAPMAAAVSAARRMAPPVFSSSLTTIAAFMPLFLIAGIMGDIIVAIPLVICCVIVASLIECFLIMPGHLRSALGGNVLHEKNRMGRFRDSFDAKFIAFREGPYRRLVSWAVLNRYRTLGATLCAFLISIGLVAGARVGFNFFPSPEADTLYVNLETMAGTKRAETEAILESLDESLRATDMQLQKEHNLDHSLLVMNMIKVGAPVARGGATSAATSQDTLGGIRVELIPSDTRPVRTDAFIQAWKANIPPLPKINLLTILPAQGGPPGRDIDVRLYGPDIQALKAASLEVQALLDRFPGVTDIEDDLPYGKPETILEVTSRGRALGFTTEIVGQQVRSALEGAIAKRFPRGEEEVTVRVRYPDTEITAGLLERLYLRSPQGEEVSLTEIVSFRENLGFATIRREDGQRQVQVAAEIDKAVTNTGEVLQALQEKGLLEIVDKYQIRYSFEGRAEEQREAFADMKLGAILGLAGMYIILAWVFGSYSRPFAVLAVIPFGFIGAVLGHLVLDYALTILSMVAMIGLSGIVVNDSIVLVSTIDEKRDHQDLLSAIIEGSCDRLRAVILTSATTIGGLTPLIFETNLQAQFLIPMAVTIVFGLMVATLLVLLVVPALLAIQGDLSLAKHSLKSFFSREQSIE